MNRCAVPYGISDKKEVEKYCIPNSLVTDFGADLIVDRAQRIDPEGCTVHTASGESYSYGNLVLATGAKPVVPRIPGVDLGNITTVRSKDNMVFLRELSKQHKKAVIVGGGYIGVEVAVELAHLGLDVTVVEMMPHLMINTMDDGFVKEIEAHMKENGINILNSSRVTRFNGNGSVSSVFINDKTEVDADFVVLAIGVKPGLELAEHSGILTHGYGIAVNDYLRTNYKNIYATGDCAEKRSFVSGKSINGEFGTNAVFMSRVVASNILGQELTFDGVLNANVSTAFEYSFGTAGLIEKIASVEGLDVVTGYSEVLDRYPMMDGVSTIKTRLVFDRETHRLVGGSVLRKGTCTAHNIDFISFAIQMKATAEDMLEYQYATQPELAAKPSDNTYVFAAQDALKKLG